MLICHQLENIWLTPFCHHCYPELHWMELKYFQVWENQSPLENIYSFQLLDLPSWLFRCCFKGAVDGTDTLLKILNLFIQTSGRASLSI